MVVFICNTDHYVHFINIDLPMKINTCSLDGHKTACAHFTDIGHPCLTKILQLYGRMPFSREEVP